MDHRTDLSKLQQPRFPEGRSRSRVEPKAEQQTKRYICQLRLMTETRRNSRERKPRLPSSKSSPLRRSSSPRRNSPERKINRTQHHQIHYRRFQTKRRSMLCPHHAAMCLTASSRCWTKAPWLQSPQTPGQYRSNGQAKTEILPPPALASCISLRSHCRSPRCDRIHGMPKTRL